MFIDGQDIYLTQEDMDTLDELEDQERCNTQCLSLESESE